MKKFLGMFLIGLFAFTSEVRGQFQGIVIQGGLSSAFSKDAIITPNGHGHYGWMLGADARLLEGNIYFIMGGQYHSSTFVGTQSANPFGKHDWAYTIGRFGVGFNFWRISEKIALRSKIVLGINFNSKLPEKNIPVGYEKINDSFAGVGSGIGLTLGKLEFDVDYQYGLLNSVFEKPGSKFDIISLAAGFRF